MEVQVTAPTIIHDIKTAVFNTHYANLYLFNARRDVWTVYFENCLTVLIWGNTYNTTFNSCTHVRIYGKAIECTFVNVAKTEVLNIVHKCSDRENVDHNATLCKVCGYVLDSQPCVLYHLDR